MSLPASWMPAASMHRIIVHWSAGGHKANAVDKRHYHILIEGDGNLVRGNHPISANVPPLQSGGYAAHTRNLNSNSIGVTVCAMHGARERPFQPGNHPITRAQWEKMAEVVAALCKRYSIPVTERTVLSHAEVQPTLGVAQAGKWDIAVLPFDTSYNTPKKVGDLLRSQVEAAMRGEPEKPKAPDAKEHVVQRGDTLWSIARQHGLSVAQITEWNRLASDRINPGDVLYLTPPPAAPQKPAQPHPDTKHDPKLIALVAAVVAAVAALAAYFGMSN